MEDPPVLNNIMRLKIIMLLSFVMLIFVSLTNKRYVLVIDDGGIRIDSISLVVIDGSINISFLQKALNEQYSFFDDSLFVYPYYFFKKTSLVCLAASDDKQAITSLKLYLNPVNEEPDRINKKTKIDFLLNGYRITDKTTFHDILKCCSLKNFKVDTAINGDNNVLKLRNATYSIVFSFNTHNKITTIDIFPWGNFDR